MAHRVAMAQRRSAPAAGRGESQAELLRLNQTLLRLQRVVGRFAKNGDPHPGKDDNAARVSRLSDRLAIVQHKMRAAFDVHNETLPENLRPVMRQLAELNADDAPPELVCPISQALMVDPVTTSDGQVYDRPSIIEWFATFTDGRMPTSPLTNLPLANRDLVAQPALRRRVQSYMNQRLGYAVVDSDSLIDGVEPPPEELAARSSSQGPIWSSAVVPVSEEGSRELNLLRVHDGLDVALCRPSIAGRASRALIAPPLAGRATPLIRRIPSTRPPRSRALVEAELEHLRTSGRPPAVAERGPSTTSTRPVYTFLPTSSSPRLRNPLSLPRRAVSQVTRRLNG